MLRSVFFLNTTLAELQVSNEYFITRIQLISCWEEESVSDISFFLYFMVFISLFQNGKYRGVASLLSQHFLQKMKSDKSWNNVVSDIDVLKHTCMWDNRRITTKTVITASTFRLWLNRVTDLTGNRSKWNNSKHSNMYVYVLPWDYKNVEARAETHTRWKPQFSLLRIRMPLDFGDQVYIFCIYC